MREIVHGTKMVVGKSAGKTEQAPAKRHTKETEAWLDGFKEGRESWREQRRRVSTKLERN